MKKIYLKLQSYQFTYESHSDFNHSIFGNGREKWVNTTVLCNTDLEEYAHETKYDRIFHNILFRWAYEIKNNTLYSVDLFYQQSLNQQKVNETKFFGGEDFGHIQTKNFFIVIKDNMQRNGYLNIYISFFKIYMENVDNELWS